MKSVLFLTAELHPDQYTGTLGENVTGRWMDFIFGGLSSWGFFFILYNLFYTSNGENVNHWSRLGLIRNISYSKYPYKHTQKP